jgi:glutathione peroxidase-family protein
MPLDGPVTLMDKVQVNGANSHPIWNLAKQTFPGDVGWNFAGIFLFDSAGDCVGRFSSKELGEAGEAIQGLI